MKYFDRLSTGSDDDIREELKNIAPKLSELTPTNPFDAPQGYFESLPSDLLNKIKRQNALVESLREDSGNVSTNPFEPTKPTRC